MSESSLDTLWWCGAGLSLAVVALLIWISSE
jgi:hypothetical protein